MSHKNCTELEGLATTYGFADVGALKADCEDKLDGLNKIKDGYSLMYSALVLERYMNKNIIPITLNGVVTYYTTIYVSVAGNPVMAVLQVFPPK